jgi:ATP-binding cassette subfamily B protein
VAASSRVQAPPPAGPEALRLRSAIPGRERWEAPVLLQRPLLAQELEAAVQRSPAVLEASANPVTGSLLVHFIPGTPGFDSGALIRERLRELLAPGLERFPRGKAVAGQPSALSRVLEIALPDRGVLAKPALLSAAAQALTLLQGYSFVSTVNTARGNPPAFLKLLGFKRPGSSLGFMSALSFGLILLNVWLQSQRRKAWKRVAQVSEQRIRTHVYAHLQTQDVELFDRYGTARLLHIVTEDSEQIGDLIEEAGDTIVEKLLIVAFSGLTLLTTSPLLTLVVCLPIPFFFLPSRLLGSRISESFARQRETHDRFEQILESSLSGIKDVKSFTAEPQERLRLAETGERLIEQSLEADAVANRMARLTEAIGATGAYTAAAYAGTLAVRGKMTQARYSWVLFLVPKLLSAPEDLEEVLRLYHKASRSAKEIGKLLDTRPNVQSGPVRLPAPSVRGEVTFENVSFGYHASHKVLHDVSFQLPAGGTLAIVGPTGSGKSTLLRLLLRFYDVGSGRILLDGRDVRELDLKDLRGAVSLVSQDVYLFRGSLRDNVRYGQPGATDEAVLEAMLHAGVQGLADTLPGGLDGDVGERGTRLSGGERQRVAIARALLKQAPILALDEATSHLDFETEAAVQRSMRRAAEDKSLIMIAHRLSTIRHAERILVLERGRIREQGTHDDLVAAGGLYASLWALQSGEAPGGKLEVRIASDEED